MGEMKRASGRPSKASNRILRTPTGVARLQESCSRGELVVVAGTGVSIGLTNGHVPALSWTGVIHHGFDYGVKKGRITPAQAQAWRPQLDSSDLDDVLGAA